MRYYQCSKYPIEFVRTVFHDGDKGGKEIDAGIKILVDKITSHAEYKLSIETLCQQILSRQEIQKKYGNDTVPLPYPESHTKSAEPSGWGTGD